MRLKLSALCKRIQLFPDQFSPYEFAFKFIWIQQAIGRGPELSLWSYVSIQYLWQRP